MYWKRCLINLAAITLFGPAGYALAQQEQTEQAAETAQAETKSLTEKVVADKKEPRKLKIFELKHALPSEFAQLLTYRPQFNIAEGKSPNGATPSVVQDGNLNVAFDDDRRLLFVRGPAKQIDRIEKLVKALDAPADKLEQQTIGNAHLIPLRHSEAGQVQSVLSQLGMATHAAQLGKASIIVVTEGDDEELEQIQEVIAKLEKAVERSEEAKTAETTTNIDQERR